MPQTLVQCDKQVSMVNQMNKCIVFNLEITYIFNWNLLTRLDVSAEGLLCFGRNTSYLSMEKMISHSLQ